MSLLEEAPADWARSRLFCTCDKEEDKIATEAWEWVVKWSLMGWFYSSSKVYALVHCEAALRDSEWFRPLSLIMESY